MATKTKKAKPKNGFKSGVLVSAAFERHNHDAACTIATKAGYAYALKQLRVDHAGNLIANAGCRDALICSAAEIPAVRDFLTQLVTARTKTA